MLNGMNEIWKVLGKRIRNFRTKRGLSQEKLAELSGCHPTYIGQLERGEKNATIEIVLKITSAPGISLSKLFENTDSNADNSSGLPLKCYELLLSKSPQEQNQLYSILSAVCKYKEI